MENNVWREIANLINANARSTIAATHPMDLVFGVVVSVNPLTISISQKMMLTDEFLILTNAVRDHSVDIGVTWTTEDETEHVHGNGNDGQDTEKTNHKHNITGRKKITIYNGLTIGEKVLLLRAQGGQDYIVLDRVDEIPTTGEGS